MDQAQSRIQDQSQLVITKINNLYSINRLNSCSRVLHRFRLTVVIRVMHYSPSLFKINKKERVELEWKICREITIKWDNIRQLKILLHIKLIQARIMTI